MAKEVLNAVSPWMGQLLWVDTPRSGKSKKGNDWKSVDFALDYKDPQGNDCKILFSAFGAEKVDKILDARIGDTVKVLWRPVAREYNGKWFAKFDAYDITVFAEDRSSKDDDMPADDELGF